MNNPYFIEIHNFMNNLLKFYESIYNSLKFYDKFIIYQKLYESIYNSLKFQSVH